MKDELKRRTLMKQYMRVLQWISWLRIKTYSWTGDSSWDVQRGNS